MYITLLQYSYQTCLKLLSNIYTSSRSQTLNSKWCAFGIISRRNKNNPYVTEDSNNTNKSYLHCVSLWIINRSRLPFIVYFLTILQYRESISDSEKNIFQFSVDISVLGSPEYKKVVFKKCLSVCCMSVCMYVRIQTQRLNQMPDLVEICMDRVCPAHTYAREAIFEYFFIYPPFWPKKHKNNGF